MIFFSAETCNQQTELLTEIQQYLKATGWHSITSDQMLWHHPDYGLWQTLYAYHLSRTNTVKPKTKLQAVLNTLVTFFKE